MKYAVGTRVYIYEENRRMYGTLIVDTTSRILTIKLDNGETKCRHREMVAESLSIKNIVGELVSL